MLRAGLVRTSFALLLAPALLMGTAVISGCGDTDAPKDFKAEDAPAAKGKGSMDYFLKNNSKKGGSAKK